MEAWTDARLDDLAASLRPLPAQMARAGERLEHVSERLDDLGEGLGKRIDDLGDRMDAQLAEVRAMRQDLSAFQRQFAQMGWGLSLALIGAVVALIVSVA